MAKKVNGRFYFKKTTNGNLLGEWSNDSNPEIFTESSDAIGTGSDSYIGEYSSTWQEKGKPIFRKLVIKKVDSKFSLQWLNSNGATVFDGEGMLCDDILIGNYHPAQ